MTKGNQAIRQILRQIEGPLSQLIHIKISNFYGSTVVFRTQNLFFSFCKLVSYKSKYKPCKIYT